MQLSLLKHYINLKPIVLSYIIYQIHPFHLDVSYHTRQKELDVS